MASKKFRDIVVKVGEYTDRNTGETKGRYENVGALMQSDTDQSFFIMLKRTFNPAGVTGSDNRESILLNCYLTKEQKEAAGGNGVGRSENDPPPRDDIEDSVPF